jgi:hypothetical protein
MVNLVSGLDCPAREVHARRVAEESGVTTAGVERYEAAHFEVSR